MASGEQVARWAYDAGFRGDALIKILAISKRESGWDPAAYNGQGNDDSVGLTQINMIGTLGPDRAAKLKAMGYGDGTVEGAKEALKNGAINMAFAYYLSGGGTDFSPWTTASGPDYKTDQEEARRIVANAGLGGDVPNEAAVDDGPHNAPQPGSAETGNFRPDQDPRQLTADAINKKANLQAQLASYLADHPDLYQKNGQWGSDERKPIYSTRPGQEDKIIGYEDATFMADSQANTLSRQIAGIDSTISQIGDLAKVGYFTSGGLSGEQYITVNPDPAAILDAKQKKQWEDYVGRITDTEDLLAKERSFDIAGDRANEATAKAEQSGLISAGFGDYYMPRPGRADFNPAAASRFSSDTADLMDLQGYGNMGEGQLAPETVTAEDITRGRTRVPAFATGTGNAPVPLRNVDPKLAAMVGRPSVPMQKPRIPGIPDNGPHRRPPMLTAPPPGVV